MSAETILNKLDTSIAYLIALNKLLDIEYDLLKKRDVEAIEALTQKKHEKLLQLESIVGIHGDQPIQLDSYVYMHEHTKMASLSRKQQSLLQERWQSLLSCLRTCQLSNQRNGQFVNLAHQNVLQALVILRGQSNTATQNSYSPDGNNHSPITQRSIAKA